MKYLYIYSGGGGAGDWRGVDRMWLTQMPPILKEKVLLKFGDVFFNHASSSTLIKPTLWSRISNIRTWLIEAVNDSSINTKTEILLDSGTSKIVNFISTNHNSFKPDEIIKKFQIIVAENNILEKYAEIIINSRVEEAVTFDVPNPFKIRTQSDITSTAFFNDTHNNILVKLSAEYANALYSLLKKDQSHILTMINGLWSKEQINSYLSFLNYKPDKIAIGGLTRAGTAIPTIVEKLNNIFPFQNLKRIHFLGCGGIKNSKNIKLVYNGENISVDNSTPMNRAIDGNTEGSSQSGYFDYISHRLYRINPETIDTILQLHSKYPTPIYSVAKMEEILKLILLHQSGHSNPKTYDARALLSFHNHDVFRVNAI